MSPVKGLRRHVLLTGYAAPPDVDAWECPKGHRIAVPTNLELVPKFITCTYPDVRRLLQCGGQARLRKARAATTSI